MTYMSSIVIQPELFKDVSESHEEFIKNCNRNYVFKNSNKNYQRIPNILEQMAMANL